MEKTDHRGYLAVHDNPRSMALFLCFGRSNPHPSPPNPAGLRVRSTRPWALSVQQNHRFKFSEFSKFSLVEWNGSDPEFEVTCSATLGMLGETWLCLKMADFFKLFAALKQHDCETISCSILYGNEDVILLAAITCFMRRE